jgi:hypothetical protein
MILYFVEDADHLVELARFEDGQASYSDPDLEAEIATWPVQPQDGERFAAELRRRFGNSHRYILRT